MRDIDEIVRRLERSAVEYDRLHQDPNESQRALHWGHELSLLEWVLGGTYLVRPAAAHPAAKSVKSRIEELLKATPYSTDNVMSVLSEAGWRPPPYYTPSICDSCDTPYDSSLTPECPRCRGYWEGFEQGKAVRQDGR